MKEDAKKMRCGNCGGRLFSISSLENGDLIVECSTCESTTEVTVTSKISLEWGEGAKGILSTF